MRAIGNLCLFLVLICTEFPYSYEVGKVSIKRVELFSCNLCYNNEGLSCKSDLFQACSRFHRGCIGTAGETTIVPSYSASHSVLKCGDVGSCLNGVFSITTAKKKYFNMATYCCKPKKCNAAAPVYVPYQDLKPNGLECPASLWEVGDTNPGTNEMVKCVGNQTQCADIEARINHAVVIAAGPVGTEKPCQLMLRLPNSSPNNPGASL